jgi:hypothetical protein
VLCVCVLQVRYMDSLSFTSLAEQVCKGDKSLVQSATQQAAHEDLEAYLGQDEQRTQGSNSALLAQCTLTVVHRV